MSTKNKTSKSSPGNGSGLETLEIGNAVYTTRLTSKFKNREQWQRPDEKKVVAIIPGTIQRIMVKVGDEVTAGTPLLILEAMKMRNEVLAPLSGVVSKIHVKEGEMVPKFKLLVVIA